MHTDTIHTVSATSNGALAQYDHAAKHILARRSILAHILAATVADFSGMTPTEIEPLIEGNIHISTVPVDAGLTNVVSGERIALRNTEDSAPHEGLILYDIIFYVRTKDGRSQIIINIEAQKDVPTRYDLIKRAVFYASRLISSQKERDFTGQNYNDIKQVYSIWICMNRPTCSWQHIHLTNDAILGDSIWQGDLDFLHIVLLGVPNQLPEQTEQYSLHRLLTILFSRDLPAQHRMQLLQNEYRVPEEQQLGEELTKMCNLSMGILEEGIAQGELQGMEKKLLDLIARKQQKGLPLAQIADELEETPETIQALLDKIAAV